MLESFGSRCDLDFGSLPITVVCQGPWLPQKNKIQGTLEDDIEIPEVESRKWGI